MLKSVSINFAIQDCRVTNKNFVMLLCRQHTSHPTANLTNTYRRLETRVNKNNEK